MPGGPNIVSLKQALRSFKGSRITTASGNAKSMRPGVLADKVIAGFESWAKRLLILLKRFSVKVHMGLFGSYKINSYGKRNAPPQMKLGNDEVNFYVSNVGVIEDSLDKVYDWSADIMSSKWDTHKAMEKLKARPDRMICDALLDQDIFAGSGNIIKNESLFIARIHPESLCGKIPAEKLEELIEYLIQFSVDFLKWEKKDTLPRHLKAYEKETCPRNHTPFHKSETGKNKSLSYYCPRCQELYD